MTKCFDKSRKFRKMILQNKHSTVEQNTRKVSLNKKTEQTREKLKKSVRLITSKRNKSYKTTKSEKKEVRKERKVMQIKL